MDKLQKLPRPQRIECVRYKPRAELSSSQTETRGRNIRHQGRLLMRVWNCFHKLLTSLISFFFQLKKSRICSILAINSLIGKIGCSRLIDKTSLFHEYLSLLVIHTNVTIIHQLTPPPSSSFLPVSICSSESESWESKYFNLHFRLHLCCQIYFDFIYLSAKSSYLKALYV